MPLKTTPFDSAAYLDSKETIAAYLSEALETNDAGIIADALGAIARARGMSKIARSAGVARPSLYRALSANGNPGLGTVLRVLGLLKLRLAAVPQGARRSATAKPRPPGKPSAHRRSAAASQASAARR
jgi:probable addiction module antidote protein